MELPSKGTSFHDASLQSRARIGSWGNVGKWEQPVVGREEVKVEKHQGIGCSSVRYGLIQTTTFMMSKVHLKLFFNAVCRVGDVTIWGVQAPGPRCPWQLLAEVPRYLVPALEGSGICGARARLLCRKRQQRRVRPHPPAPTSTNNEPWRLREPPSQSHPVLTYLTSHHNRPAYSVPYSSCVVHQFIEKPHLHLHLHLHLDLASVSASATSRNMAISF